MFDEQEYEYAVILVFPGFGEVRENAETILEHALEWLNANREEPGFRFAPVVTAHLETVQSVAEARERIEADESVAMVVLYDVEVDEGNDLVRYCEQRHVGACLTVDVKRRTGARKSTTWLSFRRKSRNETSAHRLPAETFTAPVDKSDETGRRISDVVTVLALGVMTHHWEKHPLDYGIIG